MKLITPYSFWYGNQRTHGIVQKLLRKITSRTRARIRKYKASLKLKKSGYNTWKQYKHARDKDINRYASYIEDFYKNYPYVYAIKDYKHYAFKCLHDYGPGGMRFGYDEMSDWCSEVIRWDYRIDCHRVIEKSSGLTEFDDMGGGDVMYFAFKHEKDFTHFLLRWA